MMDSLTMIPPMPGRMDSINGGDDDKGIALELDSSVAEELRQAEEKRRKQQQQPRSGGRKQVTLENLDHHNRNSNDADDDENNSGIVTDDAPYSDHDLNDDALVDGEDDWNEMLLLPPHLQQGQQEKQHSDNENDDSDQEKVEDANADAATEIEKDDETISLSPPATLPVMLIHLERIFGFAPSTAQERDELAPQIRQAIWGGDLDSGEANNQQDDNCSRFVSQEFELRQAELFETGAARHGECNYNDSNNDNAANNSNPQETEESKEEAENLAWLKLDYPPLFCPKQTIRNDKDNDEIQIYTTETCWKILLKPHDIPVVQRLLTLLRNCNQTLSYKRHLRREIVQLARREDERQVQKRRARELHSWKSGRRKEQLDQLYSVQETMRHRADLAQAQLSKLQGERDETVQRQLRQQRLATGQDVGVEAFDFASTMLFSFPTGTFLGGDLVGNNDDEDSYKDEDYCLLSEAEDLPRDDDGSEDDSYYNNDSDDFSEDGSMGDDGDDEKEDKTERPLEVLPESLDLVVPIIKESSDGSDNDDANLQSEISQPLEIPPNADMKKKIGSRHHHRSNKKARRKAVEKRKKRLEYAAKEAEHEQKLAVAKEEEERMIEACTTEELKVTQALVQTLEDRLTKVDELIETLQEEEWEDEEEGVDNTILNQDEDEEEAKKPQTNASLLDQVLAMVLGSTPPPRGKTDIKSHVQWLQTQHKAIADDWKDRFGRLPPALALGGERANDTAGQATTEEPATSEKPQQSLAPKQNADEMRKALGIENLETENWDSDDEDDGDEGQAESKQEEKVVAPRTVGLRPGGRI